MEEDCLVCYGEGKYCVSAECGKHFFCEDCIQMSLEAVLDQGQFPAFCPMCRADAMGDADKLTGTIGEREHSFLSNEREVPG